MNKRHYEHTLPNIRGSLSNTYAYFLTTATGQLFALLLVVALFYFVARLVFALAWRLFVGFVFVLIIILLIL